MFFIKRNIFLLLFLTCFGNGFSQSSIQTVDRIFKTYIKYSESTDSQENKDAMTKALQSLQSKSEEKDLPLLINVWMYYMVTDFPTRDLVEAIFNKNKSATIKAIDKRIKKKKKWEKEADFSDLINLKNELSIKQ